MATSSNAPAGGTYRNVEHAGQCILEVNAHGFPDTNKSTMIPPKFVTKYPEPIDEKTGKVDKSTRTLTKKEENRYTGMTRNASGEEAEYKAFKLFERLAQMENDPPLLIMRSYILKNFKADVLALELGISFDGIHTVAEFDAVVAVKDTGLILVEVKRQFTEEQKSKAEEQLENGKLFFQRIMSHIAGSGSHLPVVKVIMFPDEESASPTLKSDRDTHIIHKDLMMNFNPKWKDLMSELDALTPSSSFSGDDFRRFARIQTGTWCMEKYQKRFYVFDNKEASSTYLLQQNDEMINRAILTSDVRTAKNELKIVEPVTDVEHCRPQDGLPMCSGMDLIYLTPQQKDLYQNVPQAIVRGSAGSGKTLLFYLKIVDILQNHSNKNILIIAPDPHHMRMEQFVKSNGGRTTVTETFPPLVSGGVVIITLNNFFKVSPETLQSYDVDIYHVFIDDLQSLAFMNRSTSFSDVADFIERSSLNLNGEDKIFWCAVDVAQSFQLLKVTNGFVSDLFNVDRTTPRNLTIPIYILNKILRNSVEISTVVQKVRKMRVAKKHASSYVLTDNTTGHRIRSEAVTYHKLTKWTSTGDEVTDKRNDWRKYGTEFAAERVKEELETLLDPQNYGMKLNDIAILHDEVIVEEPLHNMLVSTLNITPQTIEQFIMTNNNTIIFDHHDNVASFECPFVLYLCGWNEPGYSFHYNTMTRVRTKLVVVDIDYRQGPPILTNDVILIEWEEKDGTFCRL